MSDPEVVIVGAGAAGLAAATILRRAGRTVLVLEAATRIGGRARTSHPSSLGGIPFDEGATWLHATGRNPLVILARRAGDRLHLAHGGGRRLLVGGRIASETDEQAYAAADDGWRATAERLADGPDRPLSDAGNEWNPADPWLPNVESWESSVIAAADADVLSLHDWHRNGLEDGDLRPEHGVGALLARHLAPTAGPVRCGVAVSAIDWGRRDAVRVMTGGGTVTARCCIVTVSTGVLRDERIGFTPALPDDILAALDGLPMGLLSKLGLPVAVEAMRDRQGVAPNTLIEQRLENRRAPMMLMHLQPDGAPCVTGFLGGRHAWSFAGREEDALDEARGRLAATLGADAPSLRPGGFASRWGSDPLFRGAYAYARPGHAGARAVLGRPLGEGRLVLAGEACRTDGLAGTVGGALRDGERAAQAVLTMLGDPGPWPELVPS